MAVFTTSKNLGLAVTTIIREGVATVTPVDANYFTLNGAACPKAMLVFPSGANDALVVGSDMAFTVKAGSTVNGVVPGNQAALLPALEAVVSNVFKWRLLELPSVTTLTSGTAVEVILEGLAFPRQVTLDVTSGDTVRIRYKLTSGGSWVTLGSYTSDFVDVLDLNVYSLEFQRTAGSGTTSTCTIE